MYSDITFDPLKDAINCLQHGVSLRLASEIAWDEVVLEVDDRRDYGEVREVGYMPIRGRMFCVVLTQRNKSRRIISLRRANKRETRRYKKGL
ncbi:BrnT family toxin [Caballeronia sp. LZ034LL]|uniref:BrnT family toxin n=1 Tax=Caballeronia sp. LZ034LL TaxID=3038567 RepID=UPI00285B8D90|nr:BrnT family toxin [Caballeronia sp. LZ034LL]MDR5838419.1 BrnT family toxin [Caballeronia sp. LZ034LL]